MKKNLKKYTEFLSESFGNEILSNGKFKSIDTKQLLILRKKFRTDLDDLHGDYSSKFSDLAKREHGDPDGDYIEMCRFMGKNGWGKESIRNLFSKEADNRCKYDFWDFISGSPTPEFNVHINQESYEDYNVFEGGESPDSMSGYIDLYLLKISEELKLKGGKVYLGGEGWSEFSGSGDPGHDGNEYMIRAAYGYHQTNYGKMLLDQIGLTKEEFLEKAFKDFISWFDTKWSDVLTINRKYRNISTGMKISDFSILEEDRMIIFSKEISDYVKKVSNNELEMSVEEINANILKNVLSEFGLDIQIIDNDMVIWAKFGESH